jgi:hypothetical protein
MLRYTLLALAGGLSMASDPAFAAVGTSAQVNNNASAAIVTSLAGLPGVTDTHGQAVTGQAAGVLGGFVPAAFVSVGDTSPGAHNSVEVSQDVTANWINPNQGSISVGSDWDVRSLDHIADLAIQATTIDQTLSHTAPTWQYAFDATGADSLFTMDFDVQVTGDAFGRGAWDFNVTEDGHQLRFATLANGAASGTFQQALETGHSYVVTLTSNDGITLFPDGRATQHFQANVGSQFDWRITGDDDRGGAVPEPSTWALAIAGCGLAGAALRRQPRRRMA